MNKLLLVLLSVMQATHALGDVPPPLPGQAPAGGGNGAAASGTGVSGAKLSLASIGIGSHCSSVVLEDTENPDVAWILPRVFIGVNRFRQKLFDVAAPTVAGDPWRLRFSIFMPHNVNDVIGSRGDEDDFLSHGCDFSSVENELQKKAKERADREYDQQLKEYGNWAWAHRLFGHRSPPIKVTLKPVLPYKLRVTVDKYGEAWVPSKDETGTIDTTVLQAYGFDHEVTVPFKSDQDAIRFLRDFDKDNKVGVKVSVTVFFSAARKNGSIHCTSAQGSIDTSFKGHIKANPDVAKLAAAFGGFDAMIADPKKDPVVDMLKLNLKTELANSYSNKVINCEMNGSTSDAFNQVATDISKSVVSEIVPNLLSISQQQAGALAGGLPAPLPLGSPFSPLPPLPTGGPLLPCPEGMDPVTFSQQNQGQQCDPGPGVDKDKHYIKLSALMSTVRKHADTKVDMNLIAPPSDEKYTTFVQLIGKPENKAYRNLMIPSSLGPVQVVHTPTVIHHPATSGQGGGRKAWDETKDVTSEKTMLNGRGYRTGVDMAAKRVIRLYPINRIAEDLQYRQVWKWATWRDIADYMKEGVDFRVQNHSYKNHSIADVANSEVQKRVNGYAVDDTFPVFVGSVYDRAFKVITRPRLVKNKISLPMVGESLFATSDSKDEKEKGQVAKAVDARGFNIGFRGVNKVYRMSQLLGLNDENITVQTVTEAGDGRPYLEITANKNLGELTIFNMDNHQCTIPKVLDDVRYCEPDWISRVYVDYRGVAALTGLTDLFDDNNAGIVAPWILTNDDVATRGEAFLNSSDVAKFKQVLPLTRSTLQMDLEIVNGVESDLRKLIAKKTDSIGLVADPQMSATADELPLDGKKPDEADKVRAGTASGAAVAPAAAPAPGSKTP